MDYITLLREAHAKQQREREDMACKIGALITDLSQIVQRAEVLLSSSQIAILVERVARQEALIAGEELADDSPGLRQQPPPAAVYIVPDIDPIPDPAHDEHDGLDI